MDTTLPKFNTIIKIKIRLDPVYTDLLGVDIRIRAVFEVFFMLAISNSACPVIVSMLSSSPFLLMLRNKGRCDDTSYYASDMLSVAYFGKGAHLIV